MADGIGKKLAEELKQRADAKRKLEEAADKKSTEQKATDDAALTSMVDRLREEVEGFNQNTDQPLSLIRNNELGFYTLKGVKELNFSIAGNKLQITLLPTHSPLFSMVQHGANGYTYRHIGPNGMATNRESTENEMVENLLRQACGL